MAFWFSTPTGYGVTEEAENVPPGATFITEAAYNAAIAAQQAGLAAGYAAAITQRKADYTTVYAALRSMGMPVAAATILAKGIGQTPDVDPELNVKAMTQQSAALSFNHSITAATNVYEKITEVPDITIQETGLYRIEWTALGEVTLPAGTGQSAVTTAAIYKNGAIITGTDTKLKGTVTGGTVAMPALGAYVSGTESSYQSLNSGDVISLYAKKVTIVASTHSIRSDNDGRTRIGVERIRPA